MPRPPAGLCVHCLGWSDQLTWDHVFPESWYPDTTPRDMEKWKVPTCQPCNADYGRLEERLLVRMALALSPDDARAAGIPERALRAIDPDAAKNERDRARREALRHRILGEIIVHGTIPTTGFLPNFGPQSGVDPTVLASIRLAKPTELKRLIFKFVKGMTYVLDRKYLEPKRSIKVHFVGDEAARPVMELLNRAGTTYYRGPGITAIRGVAPDGTRTALFAFDIWGRFKAYAAVIRQ